MSEIDPSELAALRLFAAGLVDDCDCALDVDEMLEDGSCVVLDARTQRHVERISIEYDLRGSFTHSPSSSLPALQHLHTLELLDHWLDASTDIAPLFRAHALPCSLSVLRIVACREAPGACGTIETFRFLPRGLRVLALSYNRRLGGSVHFSDLPESLSELHLKCTQLVVLGDLASVPCCLSLTSFALPTPGDDVLLCDYDDVPTAKKVSAATLRMWGIKFRRCELDPDFVREWMLPHLPASDDC